MRRSRPRFAACLPVVVALALVAGCSADGSSQGETKFEHDLVPFVFTVPAEFTVEEVDEANTRGDVVAVRALDKVDAIAVRKLPRGPVRVVRQRILGKQVTSRVTSVGRGWAIECQYTAERRGKVLDACREALRTVSFSAG